jgi:MGT family glycosyltransferase
MLLGALSAGQAAGVPTAALFHSPFSGFRGGPLVELLAPGIPALNALREELGLAPVTSMADVHDACAVSLVATPREFDVDIPLPANVRFIGPVRDAPPLTRQVYDLHIDDRPEPLLVVSFSTSYQGQLALLQRVVDALGALRVRVAVTTGPAVPAEALTAPDNTVVAQFVPHDRLLPRAALVVTHAGLGTVLAALSHGVPLVCLPMGRDQFFNAAMVERLGVGRTIGMDAGDDAIRAAVEGVLADPAVKDSAKHMASVIAGYGGAADAVHELERLASRP